MPNFLTKLLEPNANGPEAAQLLAKLLNVNISATTLKKEIEEHPDYPSLLSISDVLNTYGIENVGLKIDFEKLTELPTPFITQIQTIRGNFDFFTVVKSIDDNSVVLFDIERHEWSTFTKADFIERSSGVFLIAEVNDDNGEKDYATKRKGEIQKQTLQTLAVTVIPFVVIISGITAFLQSGWAVLLPLILTVLMLCGSLIGVLLLWFELDQHNPVLQQICSGGEKINCGAVLQSKGSKIFGISWSSIGFSYFMGNLLLLLFLGITNPLALFASAWINLVASPYVIFSIYYQWRVAKQWCALCLSVQALLVLQLTLSIAGGWHSIVSLNIGFIQLVLQAIIAFTLPFISTVIALPALQKAKKSKYIFNELQKMKHNRRIFDALMSHQRKVTESSTGLGIVLGNPNGAIKIIKVCSPYCGPCARAHGPLHALLHNNPDVQIQMLFGVSNEDGDERTPVVNHFLSIAEEGDERRLSQAIDDWYSAEIKDYEKFASKYPLGEGLKKHEEQIELMTKWCSKMKITGTPTIFINDYKLVSSYTAADLKYFLSV